MEIIFCHYKRHRSKLRSSEVNLETLNQKPVDSLTKTFSFKSEMYLNCLSFTEIIGELSQIIPMK
jgi:hypothetical protein